jgi:ATP-dependent exoDNAse (exonuclease V) beta subunit
MSREWMAIEEAVPGPAGAVRVHSTAGPVQRSQLAASIVAALAEAPRAPTWLVAPSRRVARQWLDALALDGTPVFNVRATTPKALSYDLAAPVLAATGRRVASPRAALVLTEKVLVRADRAGRLRSFARPRSYRRLAERMFSSIAALRMAGLTPRDIRARSGFGDTAKAHDLALVLDGYAAELAEAGLVDAADVARLALDMVTTGRVSPEWNRILLPEETDLAPCERRLFAALGDRVRLLPIDPEPGPEAFQDPTRGPALGFFRAIGEVNEIRGVLRRCLARGIPLDTVELLHTDAATYPVLVQEVLAVLPAAELPVTFAEGLPIRESRPARALAAWLGWRAEGHPQWRLVRMVRDGLLDWERIAGAAARGVTEPQLMRELRRLRIGFDLAHAVDRIEAAIVAVEAAPRAAFVRGSLDPDDDDDIDDLIVERRRGDRIAALRVLAAVAGRLVACEPALTTPATATAAELVAQARQFVADVATSSSQFDNNAKNRLLAEIREMEQWLGHHPDAEPRETLEWLAGLADTLVVMGSAPRPGCLHVASITSGGHSGRPHTFIVGLDEQRFPGPGRSDPVLPDADRAALSADLDLAAGAAAQARAEFWRLLGRLRGDVQLVFSCRDLVQQAEVFPCPLLLEVYRRQADMPEATLADFIAAVTAETESFVPRDPAAALTDSEWWLAMLGADPTPAAVRQALEQHGPGVARGLVADAARRSDAFTPWDGLVPAAGPDLDPTSPTGRVASAHSLETLGACPRRFFFRYGLDVQPLDSLEPEEDRWLDHMEEGSVLHEVLETFMRRFLHVGTARPAADAPRPVFAEHEGEILAILDDVLAAKRAEKPSTDEAAVAAGRRLLADAVRTFLRAEEAYCLATGARPVALEAAIGFVPEGPGTPFDRAEPVRLQLAGGGTLRLRGFVDRIDIDGRTPAAADAGPGYVVIDYKKGRSTRFKQGGADPLDVFHEGRRLQHGLYLLMVRHVARETVGAASDVTQFAYVFPGAHTHGERLEWTPGQLAGIDTIVERLSGIAAAGAFLPTTQPDDCRLCDFRDVCGDPAATTRAASRKLERDEGRYGPAAHSLAELFAGIRQPRQPTAGVPIARPHIREFTPPEGAQPGAPGDAAARAAIRTELDVSMLVEASAGTGKTTCMVDRMTALVRTGTATVGQIAAITFTKKAAAELARRFRERLEREGVAPDVPEAERRRVHDALAEIDAAVIGTVHSFCGRLLRERPLEAGLDPSVETMDATAEQTLRSRAWRQFCDGVGRDAALGAARRALEEAGMDLRDLRPAFETFVAHADVRAWPHEQVDPPDIRGLMERVCGEIEDRLAGVLVPWHERAASDRLMTTLETVLRAYRTRPDDSPAALFRAAVHFEGDCPKIVQGLWLPGPKTAAHRELQRERVAELEAWWADVAAELAGPLRQWRAYRYQFVIPLLAAARDHYERLRIDEGMLSFHDLLDRTARLLRERPDVRVAFAKRHPFLLVDEFQDTDPLQAEMLLLLAADDPRATDWRDTRVKPGSLFVVGDPKQSIYRFRRADIDTFEFVKERILGSGGRLLHLNTNFRTTLELVDWVNERFGDRFAVHRPAEGTAYGPGFTESAAGRRTAVTGLLTGLRQLRVRRNSIEAEAEAVAQFIRRAIDHGLTVPRTSPHDDPACRPDDFMIVTWDTGQLSTYAEALNAVGLPCDVTGRKGPDSRDDLALLHLCLRVVADADDTVAALAVLRGPAFGFSDAELHAFRKAGGTIDGRLKSAERLGDEPLAARFREAAAAFARWRRLAGSLPLAAALERIADDAGLLLVAAGAGGRAGRRGRAAAGAIATLIERVRAERTLLTSVQDVVDRIEDLVADGYPRQDFDTASIDAAAGGAVRVMNLHKVKGLEAPVVFLCDQDGPKRDRSPSWHVSRATGEPTGYLKVAEPGFFGRDGKILAAPATWDDHEAVEQRYLEAEYLRLNYVAGTRPGTCLVVSVFEDAKGNVTGGWQELAPDIASVANLPALEPHAAAEAARLAAAVQPVADAAALASGRAAARAAVATVCRPTFGTVTPRDFLTEPAERIRHTGRGLGQDWGTVIHRLLELAVQNLAAPQAEFDLAAAAASTVEASDLAESGLDRQELARRATTLVEEVLASAAWRRIVASPERHVEVPFTIAVEAAEIPPTVEVDVGPGEAAGNDEGAYAAAPVLIRGQIDAVFRDVTVPPAAGMSDWVILDWKTTSVIDADEARLREHYGPQLVLYARCWVVAAAVA